MIILMNNQDISYDEEHWLKKKITYMLHSPDYQQDYNLGKYVKNDI